MAKGKAKGAKEAPAGQAYTLSAADTEDELKVKGGGKAVNMWRLSQYEFVTVPDWFVISTDSFEAFVAANNIESELQVTSNKDDIPAYVERVHEIFMTRPIPAAIEKHVRGLLAKAAFKGHFVAVRSSGTDEDSGDHSFAGQFDSFLFQRGEEAIFDSLRRCWASCYGDRVIRHRLEVGLPASGAKMAVIVQRMVNSTASGVAFSRHPLKAVSAGTVLVEAVYGLGEGLVSGLLEADQYEVDRETLAIERELAEKNMSLVQAEGGGLEERARSAADAKKSALTDGQIKEIARVMVQLERRLGQPQDFEYGVEGGKVFALQVRPIVTLPPACFYDCAEVLGEEPVLWDNSNIIESYSGITSPLTFSYISDIYAIVYTITLRIAGVPEEVIADKKPVLDNMLGLIRGNVYYNLMNWYRALALLPIGDVSKMMDQMLGVKQNNDEIEAKFETIKDEKPPYSIWDVIRIVGSALGKVYRIDTLVEEFFANFCLHYDHDRRLDLDALTLTQQLDHLNHIYADIIYKWETPIINDTYVMLAFGTLKKLLGKWVTTEDPLRAQSIQNDLLCGQGDVESTEPTKLLMRIADFIDNSVSARTRKWFIEEQDDVVVEIRKRQRGDAHLIKDAERREVSERCFEFLDLYGFRCINELKLEQPTLVDEPDFMVGAVAGYVKTKSYSLDDMEAREAAIRDKAIAEVEGQLGFARRQVFRFFLYHARKAVRHRENMRFARTKLYALVRNCVRGMGHNLVKVDQLDAMMDVFMLTLPELVAYIEGRGVTANLRGLVALRKEEYAKYEKGIPPPERFLSHGAAGPYMPYSQVLGDLDCLKAMEAEASSDPNLLKGTPCCPGKVTGKVRVAKTIDETKGLDGEILVTARTDPGWVPLYPMCSGLLIERGSLLSHSAVVARELGLPTIVSISGGLMKRLKTGMTVTIDAGKGEVWLNDPEGDGAPAEEGGAKKRGESEVEQEGDDEAPAPKKKATPKKKAKK